MLAQKDRAFGGELMLTMKPSLTTWMFTLAMILFAARGECQGIDGKMRAADARLNTPINLPAARLYVGELLEQLSRQTGVSLQMNTQEEASGVLLLVCLNKITLGDALDALWSTVTYKNAVWRWERSGEPGAYQYLLVQSRSAKEFAGDFKEQIQRLFEEEYRTMLAAARMSPEQRRQLLENAVSERYQGDKKLIERYLSDSRRWMAMRAFEEALSSEERLRVLRGEKKVRLPVSQLSKQGTDFVEYLWKEAETGKPIPDSIYFEANKRDDDVAPSFFIILGGSGYSYLGGRLIADKSIQQMTEKWIQSGDLLDTPLSAHKLVRTKKSMEIKADTPLEQYLVELSLLAPLSLIARLPQKEISRDFSELQETVEYYLAYLRAFPPYLEAKWRHNVLLLSFPGWIWETESYVPYAHVKQMRLEAQRNSGFLPFRSIAKVAALLKPDQLEHLGKEFPIFDCISDRISGFVNGLKEPLGGLQGLFAWGYRNPEIFREGGMSLDQAKHTELLNNFDLRIVDSKSLLKDAKAVRILETSKEESKRIGIPEGRRNFWIEFQTPAGEWSRLRGLDERPHTPRSQPVIPR
jgi:hypothetical protein